MAVPTEGQRLEVAGIYALHVEQTRPQEALATAGTTLNKQTSEKDV